MTPQKLRNKKTGEIGDLMGTERSCPYITIDIDFHDGNPRAFDYTSLEQLNEEWEDYEETKGYWFINTACHEPIMFVEGEPGEMDKELGNHFETREECERAYEKFKAWKFGGKE